MFGFSSFIYSLERYKKKNTLCFLFLFWRSCFDGNRDLKIFFILVRKVYLLDTLCLVMKEFFVGFITVKK